MRIMGSGTQASSHAVVALVSNDPTLERIMSELSRHRGVKLDLIRSEEHANAAIRGRNAMVRVIDMHAASPVSRADRDAISMWAPEENDILVLAPAQGAVHGLHVHAYRRKQFVTSAEEILGPLLPAVSERDPSGLILGQSESVRRVCAQIRSVSRYRDVSVLILGETGTGKELVARALHELTASSATPFIAVNCAAIPASLFESELFGHEAGAFTGAKGPKPGLFELAAGGTLFLDEVGELPSDLQPKLLRALETREFRRVGGSRTIPLKARVVSATHRGLNKSGSSQGSTLRLDLHFRLAGFTIELPALRDRVEDVDLLARHFLEGFIRRSEADPKRLSDDALDLLARYDWPGNIRELKAVVERAAILACSDLVQSADIEECLGSRAPTPVEVDRDRFDEEPIAAANDGRTANSDSPSISGLRRIERDLLLVVFEDCQKNLSLASRVLGLPRSTLRDKLRRYGAM